MTSTYPGAIDDFAESSPTYMSDPDATGRTHEARHDDVEAAIEQVEETLGVNPQGWAATVAERLEAVESSVANDGFTTSGGNNFITGGGHVFRNAAMVQQALINDQGLNVAGKAGIGGPPIPAANLYVTAPPEVTPLWVQTDGGSALIWDYAQSGYSTYRADDHTWQNRAQVAQAHISDAGMEVKGRNVATHYWDETVGRRLFVWDTGNARWQMIYGDTGWRDVSEYLLNGWTGTLQVRRIDNTVSWRQKYSGIDGAAASQDAFLNPLDADLAPFARDNMYSSDHTVLWFHPQSSTFKAGYWYQNSWHAPSYGTAGDRYVMPDCWSYPAAKPWPTVLPGVAYGSIPTAENLLPGQADIDGDIPTGLTPDTDTSDWTVTYPDGPTP